VYDAEVRVGFWEGRPRESDPLQDLGIGVKIILNCTLRTPDERTWSGVILLKIGTDNRLL
jgi:hypothetical protein